MIPHRSLKSVQRMKLGRDGNDVVFCHIYGSINGGGRFRGKRTWLVVWWRPLFLMLHVGGFIAACTPLASHHPRAGSLGRSPRRSRLLRPPLHPRHRQNHHFQGPLQ